MEYIEEIQEQVILVGVQLDENDNVKESLDELFAGARRRCAGHRQIDAAASDLRLSREKSADFVRFRRGK